MADSLKASVEGLTLVDQARRQRRWNKTASAWYQQAFTSRSTLNRFWARQPIRTEAFIALCEVLGVAWQQVADLDGVALDIDYSSYPRTSVPASRLHWGDAPDVKIFYGRGPELATLTNWITSRQCRLLLIRGMGGMGKTLLTAKLAHCLAVERPQDWDWLVWRSLRNAPPLAQLLEDILEKLDPNQRDRPTSIHDAQLKLLDFLRNQRGLLVLDNLETLLTSQPNASLEGQGCQYETGFADYGEFFRVMGESHHQSCLILTSREVPRGMAKQLGTQLPMRCFPLSGLHADDIQLLFRDKGDFSGSVIDWQTIIHQYAGNPLALKIVATSVRDFFEGSLTEFLSYLKNDPVLFDDIKDLLDRQFERLSSPEQAVMFWIAINREPIALSDLQKDICHLRTGETLAALASLQHRSLLEKQGNTFTQQPVVMEYVLAHLITATTQALLHPEHDSTVLQYYALAKAQAKDYVYSTQVKLILEPICHRLHQQLHRDEWIAMAQRLLNQWQQQPQRAYYGPGNLLNLMRVGRISLQGLDLSMLPVWQANLQGLSLREVSLAQADVSGSVFTEMIGNVLSAAFSSDGKILGTSDNGYCIRLWDVATGQLLNICKGHRHWIRGVCFSPRVKGCSRMLLASGSADQTVRIWDMKTGAQLQVLEGHSDEVFAVSFCPWGEKIISASGDRTLRLWDVNTGDCLGIFVGHQDRVRTVACGAGTTLASGDERGVLRIWDFQTESCLLRLEGHQGWVRSVAFTSDGAVLASAGNDGMVRLWDVKTGTLKQEWLAHPGGVYALSFSKASDLLATGGADHQIRLWDLADGTCLSTIYGHGNQIYSVLFSPDYETLAGVSLDQTVKLWDWQQNRCLKTWKGYTDWGFPVTVSEDGALLVSGSGANTLHVWETHSLTCLQSLAGYPALIRAIVMISPETIAVAGAHPVIQLWNWKTQHCVRQLRGHQDWVLNLAIRPGNGGSCLASCSADQTIRIWDIQTGQEKQVLAGHQDQVNAIAFCPLPEQSYLFASGSSDHQVKVWNWQTGACLQTLEGHSHRVYGLCFHPNQPLLVSAGGDLSIRIWEVESGNCVKVLRGHEGWIFAIAMSPCGHYLVSGGQDEQVKLWDLNSGECIRSFKGHRHQIYSVAFSPSGDWFVSGSQDQTIRIWDVKTGECRHQLSARLYEGMDITGTQGLSIAQRTTLEELGAISQ